MIDSYLLCLPFDHNSVAVCRLNDIMTGKTVLKFYWNIKNRYNKIVTTKPFYANMN